MIKLKDFVEKRKERRLRLRVRFKYQIVGDGLKNLTYHAVSVNISASGLLFETKNQIPLDTVLKIELSLLGEPVSIIELEARVVRLERISDTTYAIGIEFIDPPAQDKEEIKSRLERTDIYLLLENIDKKDVSDLHLTFNSPPMVRIFGVIKPLSEQILSGEEITEMVYSLLNSEQLAIFEKVRDFDFAFTLRNGSRFRVSVYQQRGVPEVVFRKIQSFIKAREELGLPEIIHKISLLKDGIIFVSGPSGAGKTTTINAMVDYINKRRGGVILSLEQPIEYVHKNEKAIVKQREVGIDVTSFASGLRAALRQDPDVIVVGESFDAETLEIVVQAAETGHLVITSIHATDTVQTFERIISLFPAEQRRLLCNRLSQCFRASINQRLLMKKDGTGRVVATEVCVANTAIRRLIYTEDFVQIPSVVQTGSKANMHLMEDSITRLFEEGKISSEVYDMHIKKRT
ncbi:MAG: PilT/PilU family type 4a pilus ATPase [Candidatus Omnitrophica bacterium]|nr:PilT/PilU family type 4a pilus ATPase [Candidatus Omnitrophota bacterium]MBU1870001.1 PilT/PilU family type 4a pilus ATPase [Candidatus Omnitrophota bacterium]